MGLIVTKIFAHDLFLNKRLQALNNGCIHLTLENYLLIAFKFGELEI